MGVLRRRHGIRMTAASVRSFLDDDADDAMPAARGSTHGYVTPMALDGPCPCDGCEFAARCVAGLACARFAAFCDGESEARWRSASGIPTRRRFDILFATDPQHREPLSHG